jgi:hypothetical protein
LGGDVVRVVAERPGGEAEYSVAGYPDVVLAAHVRPGVAWIQVLTAVDFDL